MIREKLLPGKILDYTSIFEFENFLTKSRFFAVEKTLLKVRISQINKCHFCEDLHAQELRSLGEPEYRIRSIVEWRTQDHFTEIERTIFEVAEQLSMNDFKLSEETIAVAYGVLDHVSMSQVITIVLVTNFWNRFFTGTLRIPAVDTFMQGYISGV